MKSGLKKANKFVQHFFNAGKENFQFGKFIKIQSSIKYLVR